MTPVNFERAPVQLLSRPPRSLGGTITAQDYRSTWRRSVLEAAGTLFLLSGIAVSILTLRSAFFVMHYIMH
jgi:hypothetical protein